MVELRRVRHREVTRHQVYLPPLEDRAKAADKVREIRARGVRDVAVIPKGPLANGISLGVFRVTGNRNRRVAALERLGYQPLSRDHVAIGHRFPSGIADGGGPRRHSCGLGEAVPGAPARTRGLPLTK